jgi:hypothetical protein
MKGIKGAIRVSLRLLATLSFPNAAEEEEEAAKMVNHLSL